MYPFIEPISGVLIYTFGIAVAICFFMFLRMLKKLSVKFNFDFVIFKKNILWLFLSVFVFSRLFYVISRWSVFKHIENPVEFFVMSDYNFSLFGAIFGFLLVFFVLLRIRKEKLDTFISGLVLSFLFILPVGYIGALLGGQVYGIDTNYGIEITYTHKSTPVPYQVPVFPLPIIYAILYFALFAGLYVLSMNANYRTILAYLGLMLFSCISFILEFWSGKLDIFKDMIGINLAQICALFLFGFCIYRLIKVYSAKIE